MQEVRVLALTPHQVGHSPGQRSSIELWERVLTPQGIHVEYAPFETAKLRAVHNKTGHHLLKAAEMLRAYMERIRLLTRLKPFDAVFVYREAALLGPAFIEKQVFRQGIPIIYQLDDPHYVPYRSPSNGYLSYLKCFGKVADICRMSRVVIVNSTQHREYVQQYNQNIWQIPSVVDTDRYVYRPRAAAGGPVVVGWSGSPTTVGNLAVIAEPLKELAAREPHELYLVGGTQFNLPGVRYKAQAWKAETEVDDLRRMDMGVVPLPVNEWNKRKFYMKVAQYMALGISHVATPMGSNPEVIQPGVTGFLADTASEWVECLTRLIRDPGLREDMGRKGAQIAEEKFSLRANTPQIIEAFRTAVS